jgi:peptidoglycan/LPS O-acetylase OafA/YrhL
MTINFFPGYVIANEGCFYWGWFTACEMQLFLIIPILVYIIEFKLKNRKLVQIVVILGILALGTFINYHVIYVNNMAAGLFASQDILIYKLWLNKPYTKLHSVALGMFMAQLFLGINHAKTEGKFEAYVSSSIFRSGWAAAFASLGSLGLITFLSTYPRSANNDPASWSREKSAIFISLSRPAFLICLICLFYIFWLNHGLAFKRFFSRRLWAMLARLSYGVYLVFPITSAQFNSSMESALYLTYNEMFF